MSKDYLSKPDTKNVPFLVVVMLIILALIGIAVRILLIGKPVAGQWKVKSDSCKFFEGNENGKIIVSGEAEEGHELPMSVQVSVESGVAIYITDVTASIPFLDDYPQTNLFHRTEQIIWSSSVEWRSGEFGKDSQEVVVSISDMSEKLTEGDVPTTFNVTYEYAKVLSGSQYVPAKNTRSVDCIIDV